MPNYTNANNTLIIFARWRHHMVPILYIVNDQFMRSGQSRVTHYHTVQLTDFFRPSIRFEFYECFLDLL